MEFFVKWIMGSVFSSDDVLEMDWTRSLNEGRGP